MEENELEYLEEHLSTIEDEIIGQLSKVMSESEAKDLFKRYTDTSKKISIITEFQYFAAGFEMSSQKDNKSEDSNKKAIFFKPNDPPA